MCVSEIDILTLLLPVIGRKDENFQKWTVGKSPPHSPQPHLNPTISSYIEEQLLKCLWSEQVVCFHLMSSCACMKMKNPSNTPPGIGLIWEEKSTHMCVCVQNQVKVMRWWPCYTVLTYCVVVFVVVVAKCDLFVYITGYFENICSNFRGCGTRKIFSGCQRLDNGRALL